MKSFFMAITRNLDTGKKGTLVKYEPTVHYTRCLSGRAIDLHFLFFFTISN